VNARTVVVDVVVTGKDGQPVMGLNAEDFAVTENGKPQSITSFEAHSGGTAQAAKPVSVAELPPNTFTNIPQTAPTDSLTVLLLDSLNTAPNDQRFVKQQILAFLKTVRPGRRMAIFTLSNHLRFVQGFSDDPATLAAALNNPRLGTNPKSSPLLQSDQEKSADQQTIANMQEHDPAGAAALSDFLQEQKTEQADVRAKLTLTAFQDLGHYLAGFPGRKNIVWFSGSFPLMLFPPAAGSIDAQRFNDEAVKKTDALLSAAQVSVYPIGAQGVAASVIFDADHQAAGATTGQQAQQQIASDRQMEMTDRDAAEAAMDQIAQDTGGIAIRNTNGLADAINRVLQHGSTYYTLTYTPTHGENDGQFRKIQVRLTGPGHSKGARLAYRQGYYALDARASQKLAATPGDNSSGGDPLRPLMDLGMPASTQVPLVVRVQKIESDGQIAGGNAAIQGARTRYAVTFMLSAKDLQFQANPDGSQHDRVEATLLVYNQEGRPLNWLVREVPLDMDAARFAKVQGTGIHFKLEIDAPKEGLALRSGVYDLNAEKAGTLEMALDRIAAEPPAEVAGDSTSPLKLADNVATRTVSTKATESAGVEQAKPTIAPTIASTAGSAAGSAAAPAEGSKAAVNAIPTRTKPRSIAFWSQPAENIDPALLQVPTENESRYEHLRQDFKALHCTTEEMEEQPIGHKGGRNLICTLPGSDGRAPVVVAARYDRRSGSWGASQRWGEALMLPLLFNALRAEPRQHTFVFVALDGEAGEKTFFSELRKKSTRMPTSLVVLDSLGLGAPTIYTYDAEDMTRRSKQRAGINRVLAAEAMISAEVLQLPSPMPGAAEQVSGRRALLQSGVGPEDGNFILQREDEFPSILISSAPPSPLASPARTASPAAFHQDFDFIAYLLCRIDNRLAVSDETAVSTPGKMSPEER